MPKIRRPTGDEQLAAVVELNHAEGLRLQGRLPWVELHDDKDCIWVFAGDTWPRNQVAGARFTEQTAHDRISEILSHHLDRKVACNWVVGPASQPADLGGYLRAHGFRCMIHCAGMAHTSIRLAAKPSLPAGVEIAEIDEPASLQPLTTDRRRKFQRALTLTAEMRPRQVWHFSATIGNEAIGLATISSGAGVAGLYGVEVVEKWRQRGIGTGLVYACVKKARELGFATVVLSATNLGKGVYERVGFGEVCRMSYWKYGKMRQL